MKKSIILCLVAAGMAAIACNTKESVAPAPEGGRVVTVRAVSAPLTDGTKVIADDAGKFTWEEGDAIGVWTGSELTKFTLDATSAGEAEGTFTGTLPAGGAIDENSYAVYPYDYVTVEGTTAKLNVNSGFWARQAPARLVPMFAKAGTGHTSGFQFKHLGAVARFSIENLPEEIIAIYLEIYPGTPRTIWAKNGTTADLSAAEPQFAGTGDEGYAFAIPSEAASYKKLDICVPIIPGEYSDQMTMKVKMFKDTGASEVGSYTKVGRLGSKSTTYSRGQLLSMPAIVFPKAETGAIQATIEGDLHWNQGATLGLYDGSAFVKTTLDEASVGALTGNFTGGVPDELSYAVTPAVGPALSGTTLTYNVSRYEYPMYPITYGTVSAASALQMHPLTALLKVTVKNVPVEAKAFYFEGWGGANLMFTSISADLSGTPAPVFGDGIDWAFSSIPEHTEIIPELVVYVPIKTGTYENQLNWCLCYTTANAFGNEISEKSRFWSITPASPTAINVGDVFDLGSVELNLK